MKIDPRGDEDGLDDSRSDEADSQGLVLPLRDRIQNDGGSDVRDDQEELQENRQVHDVVLAVLGDVRGWVVQNVLEEDVARGST